MYCAYKKKGLVFRSIVSLNILVFKLQVCIIWMYIQTIFINCSKKMYETRSHLILCRLLWNNIFLSPLFDKRHVVQMGTNLFLRLHVYYGASIILTCLKFWFDKCTGVWKKNGGFRTRHTYMACCFCHSGYIKSEFVIFK